VLASTIAAAVPRVQPVHPVHMRVIDVHHAWGPGTVRNTLEIRRACAKMKRWGGACGAGDVYRVKAVTRTA